MLAPLRRALVPLSSVAFVVCGCSSSDGAHSTPPDAATSAGGSARDGGNQGSGGALVGGGAVGTSGTTGTSGTGGSGGASASDGAVGSGGVTAAGGATTGTDGGPLPPGAVEVSVFLDSLGVCTHIGQGVDSAAPSATAIQYAGLRNLRDDGNPGHVQDWITVHRDSGARVSLLTDRDIASTLDMAKALNAAGALLAVEGPNEPNNFPVTYQGATSGTSFLPVAQLQRDLYAAVKAEPSLKGIPVFHSSEAGGSEPDNMGLQFLTIPTGAGTSMPDGTRYADYANTHDYIVGHSSALVDNLCWSAADPTLNGDWDGLYVEYGKTWRGGYTGYSTADLQTLPRVTTETGWTTSGTGSITEEQQGRLFLNLYLSAFKRGWSYTFIYMLRDDPGQGYWGLFDTSYQPKKSGTYLHNLTTILSAPGAKPGGSPEYSLSSLPTTVHDLLMRKGDQSFALVVWNERPSGGSDDVTVTFPSAHRAVTVYDPITGTSPVKTLANVASLVVTVTDHPVVVSL